jgi:hypothetical protein
MTENVVLIETSFADAIAIIAAAPELPEQTRRHWSSSLRQIAKALDKPVQVIPARYNAVRADLVHLHHAPAGLTAKTLQNHKSNAKSALLWLAREKGVPEHGAPLTPVWQDLWSEIGDALVRSRLSSLMRFCSANKIAPAEVDEAVLDRFMDYRSRTGSCSDDAFRRLLAGMERECWDHPGLARAHAYGAAGQACRGAGVGGFSRRTALGCRPISPGPDQGPSEPDWTTHPALKTVHD